MSQDAITMTMIRSDLVGRIDAIVAAADSLSLISLCDRIDAIRRIARRYRLEAVESLASLIQTAAAYHGHGAVILTYLDLMRDAVDCEVEDSDASATYVAALSLRLGA